MHSPARRPRLVINDRFPAQTSAYESVNVPGLYFAVVTLAFGVVAQYMLFIPLENHGTTVVARRGLDQDGVTVHFKTESGRFNVRGDHAIVAIPFSVLRTVEG